MDLTSANRDLLELRENACAMHVSAHKADRMITQLLLESQQADAALEALREQVKTQDVELARLRSLLPAALHEPSAGG